MLGRRRRTWPRTATLALLQRIEAELVVRLHLFQLLLKLLVAVLQLLVRAGELANHRLELLDADGLVGRRFTPRLRVADALKLADSIGLPAWVQVDISKMEGVFKKVPDRDEFGAEINESLIVELYSR